MHHQKSLSDLVAEILKATNEIKSRFAYEYTDDYEALFSQSDISEHPEIIPATDLKSPVFRKRFTAENGDHPLKDNRDWVPQDERLLIELFRQGKSDREIANALSRSPGAIRRRRSRKGMLR